MKTTTIIFGLMSIVSASLLERQDTSSSASHSTSAPAPTATPDTSPIGICLSACNPTDVNCRAQCVGGAHPNSAQVNQTNSCIVGCPVGDGSISQTNEYNACVQGCITSHYLMGQTAGPVSVGTSTGVSASATGPSSTGSSASHSTGASGSHSSSSSGARPTGTQTSGSGASAASSAAPTSSSNAASGPIFVSAGGITALFLAFFAL